MYSRATGTGKKKILLKIQSNYLSALGKHTSEAVAIVAAVIE